MKRFSKQMESVFVREYCSILNASISRGKSIGDWKVGAFATDCEKIFLLFARLSW